MDKKKMKRFNKIWLLSIVVMTFFVGIGYAELTSNVLDIAGEMTSSEKAELYISDVTNTSSVDADLDNSIVDNYYKTLMTGKVVLSNSNSASSITYQVTVTNDSSVVYAFKEVIVDSSFYDNENITYTLDGIDTSTKITAHSSITFSITFSYLNGTLPDNNTLDYTLQFKFSSVAVVDVIQSLVEESDDTSTDVITTDSSDDNCTNTLAYDGTDDKNLRYVGSNPCNYVSFNNELYRIIGVMNNVDDGTGNTETRVKIIKATSIGNYSWDYKQSGVGSSTTEWGSNDWSDSQLMMMLNTSTGYSLKEGYTKNEGIVYDTNTNIVYQEGCAPTIASVGATSYTCKSANYTLNSGAISMIDNAVWYLGGSPDFNNETASIFYKMERGNVVYSGHPTNWTGKVALMYASDYGYATSGGSTTNRSSCLSKYVYNWNNYEDCYNNDWLYDSSYFTWTMFPGSKFDRALFAVYDNGRISYSFAFGGTGNGEAGTGISSYFKMDVKPTLYLSSSVIITSGDGSSSNPYQLSMN